MNPKNIDLGQSFLGWGLVSVDQKNRISLVSVPKTNLKLYILNAK